MQPEIVQLCDGPWEINCLPNDGARISLLRYNGFDLLTTAPSAFKAPSEEIGKFETRPVYGYDDCFPSVEVCTLPLSQGVQIEDHGEACWIPWTVNASQNELFCQTRVEKLDVQLTRRVIVRKREIEWRFRVDNESANTVHFQHVMHPLMSPQHIEGLTLPEFGELYDRERDTVRKDTSAADLARQLICAHEGSVEMFFLRDVRAGSADVKFTDGPLLRIEFPKETFETLAIWWNRGGHPGEKGLQRQECALEPLAGPISDLELAYESGRTQSVAPQDSAEWSIRWRVMD